MNNLERLLLGSRTAVLVIDVQNDYCHHNGALASDGNDVSGVAVMMPNLHGLLSSARASGVPVIFIQTIHEAATDSDAWKMRAAGKMSSVCRRGSWGAEFFEVSPEPGEVIVNKHRYSAFINTRLDSVLRAQKIETLIVTGVSTNVCVESTARDGYMLDYSVILASNACAAYSKQAHEMTLENIAGFFGTVADTQAMIDVWSQAEQSVILSRN